MSELLDSVLGAAPTHTLLVALAGANAVAGVAVATVAVSRLLVRRRLGPAAAYQLWGLPLLVFFAAMLALLMPRDGHALSAAAALAAQTPQLERFAIVWAAGAAGLAAVFAIAQARFLAQVRAGRGGPAVVGLISPRIVMPADDDYTPEERALIRAHERAHVARKDPRAAALAAVFQCLCWFNPLAHLAAYLLRLDQELACDAAVIMSHPGKRGLYARTLLKTQLAGAPLPFGCYWTPPGRHPLEVRIGMLKGGPDKAVRRPGGLVVVLASVDAIRP
ncbi:M56 family metallopeptidase [Phenylobacterium sp.]|jgi:beta-lactamase regulating signal transducer with metallopeptidase domain|uniref:M56 family metallopeptidase n=1 Tax=Phenylobacterium sp. TaxID=1871053 RepID=UPI002F94BFEF